MEIYTRKDGRLVPATYHPTKKRYQATLTDNGQPNYAATVDDLKHARHYGSIESVARALRKKREGKLT